MTSAINNTATVITLDFGREVNVQSVTDLADRISGSETGSSVVTIDMSSITLLDGAGIGAVAYLYRRITASGRRVEVNGARGQPLAYMNELGLAPVLNLPRPVQHRRALRFGLARAA